MEAFMRAHIRSATSAREAGHILLMLLAMLVLGATPSLAASCPSSQMAFGTTSVFVSNEAVFDSSIIYGGNSGHRTAYDLPAGTVEVLHCCGSGVGYTRVRDEFDVVGVPAGTRVTVVAEMPIEGWILSNGCSASGCSGYLDGEIVSALSRSLITLTEHLYDLGRVAVSGRVRLPMTIVAGQPQVLEFALSARRHAGGNHGAEGIGHILFTGLPAGTRVVSCNGYGDALVPARRESWGQVKTIYR
jgi:hypothetical protein